MELIKLNGYGKIEMSSRDIAEYFDKRHSDVMRDIRSEIKKSEMSEEKAESFFALCFYKSHGRKRKQYRLSKKGILQITARYDAKTRMLLIEKIESLENQNNSNKKLLVATQNLLKVVGDHDDQIKNLDYKIESQITIDHGEQRKIKNAVNRRVIERMKGKESKAYQNSSLRGLYYASIYRMIYETFGVSSYRDVKRKDFKDCITLINAWIEPAKIKSKVS